MNTMNPDDEKSREVRLGLVMYGGVSLAIYINGVAHEFFRAVRGRGTYRLIKALTDSDIVVDIISGTSAGGINGVMLAYALCNDREFASAANLWRTHGDIGKLLRATDATETATSLLNSEGFYQPKLESVFASMPRCQVVPGGEDRSQTRELDLFVTGTNVHGRVYTQFDDAGHAIDVKDHRGVFVLRHREGRKSPFGVDSEKPDADDRIRIEALAKLSRLTSCFPAAFAPVEVAAIDPSQTNLACADELLQGWGKLGGKEGEPCCFVDGGVLDNKPFTYTIKAIFSRCADREVDRKLFYVEPDPEAFSDQPKTFAMPNMVEVVMAALIGIPGYESIADDLKLLGERNSKVEQYNRLVRDFVTKKTGAKDGPKLDATLTPGSNSHELWQRTRCVAICDRVLRGIIRQNGHNQPITDDDRRKHGEKLSRSFDEQLLKSAEAREPILIGFDVYYRLRRIQRLNYLLHDLLYPAPSADMVMKKEERRKHLLHYRALWMALNDLYAVHEVVRGMLERFIDEAVIAWDGMQAKEIWDWVRQWSMALLDPAALADAKPTGALPPHEATKLEEQRTTVREVFASPKGLWQELWPDEARREKFGSAFASLMRLRTDELVAATQRGEAAPAGCKGGLLPLLDSAFDAVLAHFVTKGPHAKVNQKLDEARDTFDNLDAHLYPLEVVGGLEEKDVIETFRISPKDARRGFSNCGFSDKVAGDGFYHFGGFFKRSWRSNDILWGRLDGACQLVETLLTPERLKQLLERGDLARVRDRFLDAEGNFRAELDPAQLYPRSGTPTHEALRTWLRALLSGDEAARGEQFDAHITLLVEATQLEILNEDLQNVLVDAFGEQAEWNLFKVAAPLAPDAPAQASDADVKDQADKLQHAERVRADAADRLQCAEKTCREMAENLARADEAAREKRRSLLEMRNAARRSGAAPAEGNASLETELLAHLSEAPFVFKPGGVRYDPLFANFAALERTQLLLKTLAEPAANGAPQPALTNLGKFFKGMYRVGAEDLTRDIPTLVLLELLAHTLLVVRNCVFKILPPKLAEKVGGSALYKFGVKLPLNAFYYGVIFARRAPFWEWLLACFFGPACVVAIVVGIVKWSQFDAPMLALLILLPSILLYILLKLLIFRGRRLDPER